MAFIVKRRRSDGSVGYQVRWRQDGRWQSDIFDTERKAARFKLDVEDDGDRWPTDWVPGVGYVKDVGPASTLTPFLDFAEGSRLRSSRRWASSNPPWPRRGSA
jgi:hypothetical protein